VVLFLLIQYGIPAWMASRGGSLAQAFARGTNPFGMLGWFVLALCWFAALMSFLDVRRKRRLLETRTDLGQSCRQRVA
jgi:restriction system protein